MGRSKQVPPIVLTIAGTDPSGGAGINVDLQVFRDRGCHGVSAISAVVWQNTQGIDGWRASEPCELRAQLRSVASDFEPKAVKIGMLPTANLVAEVVDYLDALDDEVSVVLDPVMVGGKGEHALMSDSGRRALERLAHRVDLVTPNGPEAETMTGDKIEANGPEAVTASLVDRGWKRVLLKGGHLRSDKTAPVVDWYGDGDGVSKLEGFEAVAEDVRGTGCQLSSAIAAERAVGGSWAEAIGNGRRYLNHLLLTHSYSIGNGRPIVVRAERRQ